MTKTDIRTERDAVGPIEVSAERYWGAQTQRCLENFSIGVERMPMALIRALAIVKQAAARTNVALGTLAAELGTAIEQAAAEVAAGRFDDEFPLPVWQTGSGTQTNMNVNEVVAGRANEILTGCRGGKDPVHPNDHVNLGQSSNDSVPTAMHIAAVIAIEEQLTPALEQLTAALAAKAREFESVVKIGRTHLQDAVPLTVGQEFSAWARQVELGIARLDGAVPRLREIAQGGTAVGTGLNAHADFGGRIAAEISRCSGTRFVPAANRFEAIASHDTLVECSGVLNTIAASLNKVANDVRLLASGPRCGLGELEVPANEPGSSIMPGKVNPTQAEALAMVCARVIGNHATITVAGAQSQLQLQTFKPVIIDALLQSVRLLADAARSLAVRCIAGIRLREQRIAAHVERSLMLVTALVPHIGYDAAARVAKLAADRDLTLREAAIESGAVTAADYDRWVAPGSMVGPGP